MYETILRRKCNTLQTLHDREKLLIFLKYFIINLTRTLLYYGRKYFLFFLFHNTILYHKVNVCLNLGYGLFLNS